MWHTVLALYDNWANYTYLIRIPEGKTCIQEGNNKGH